MSSQQFQILTWLDRTKPYAYVTIFLLFAVTFISTILTALGFDITALQAFTAFVDIAICLFTIGLFTVSGRRVSRWLKKSDLLQSSTQQTVRARKVTARVVSSTVGLAMYAIALSLASLPFVFFTPAGFLMLMALWNGGELITSATQIFAFYGGRPSPRIDFD